MQNKIYDVIILGSGPAGLTAAIYATRANLKTLVIAGQKWGGQLMLTTEVENFPGFPEGIQGPDLMEKMRKQAEKYGAEFIEENFSETDFSNHPFNVTAAGVVYKAKSVIIATGADTKWLNVPGEQEKIGRGVSTCAPCDGPFFKNKNVIVAGGGDSAMEEAIVLARYTNSVTLVHRRDEFRASYAMVEKAKENPKIKFVLDTQITEILGDFKVTGVKLLNNKTQKVTEMPIDGVFVAIGHIPNSKLFEGIDCDDKGYILVKNRTETNIDGVFVAGDVFDRNYMQAIAAAGSGCCAALDAERWLENH